TTGYRWFIPQSASLANYLLAGINSGLAGLFGPGGHHLVWGGSWAISRRVFDGVALGQKWKQTLSDDLVASRALRAAGKPVGFEPGCLVGSPLDQRFAQVFEFIRRQYTIARFYVPRWWLLAVVASTFTNVALWGSLVLAAALASSAAPRWWMPLAGGATLYALGAIKTALRHQIAQTCLPQHGDALRQLAGFDIAAWPLAALVNWAGLVASAVGDTITWRGIRYRMGRGGVVRSVERLAPASLAFTGKTAAPEEESPPSRRAAS
ncbi:MAG: hypothetical protein KDA63_00420, partial [Planctomycetales bacterium]|nr:hypothetical protein [Planctomycetales bacterium]